MRYIKFAAFAATAYLIGVNGASAQTSFDILAQFRLANPLIYGAHIPTQITSYYPGRTPSTTPIGLQSRYIVNSGLLDSGLQQSVGNTLFSPGMQWSNSQSYYTNAAAFAILTGSCSPYVPPFLRQPGC